MYTKKNLKQKCLEFFFFKYPYFTVHSQVQESENLPRWQELDITTENKYCIDVLTEYYAKLKQMHFQEFCQQNPILFRGNILNLQVWCILKYSGVQGLSDPS